MIRRERESATKFYRETLWLIANMFSSLSLNHAVFAPPALVTLFSVLIAGVLYSSNTTPRDLSSATSEATSSTAQNAVLAFEVPAPGDGYPLVTATITTVLLGWVLIFVGIALFVFALHSQTIGNFFLKILLSLLYGISGIALAFFPVAGVVALTLMLGTLLLIQAGLLTAIALQLEPVEGWVAFWRMPQPACC